MNKLPLSTLKLDDVIRRLLNGEVAYAINNCKYFMIDGVLCYEHYGITDINVILFGKDLEYTYFKLPDELKLEVGKRYVTRDGQMAFITFLHTDSGVDIYEGVIVGEPEIYCWDVYGRLNMDLNVSGKDIVSEWRDKDA